jgi:hypothetical protein
MYLKRSIDSITYIPEISDLADNTNRLYNVGGNLYFNGAAVGAGTGDSSNVWVNANDYNTYATLTNSINVSYAITTENVYNTWKTVNTAIDTVQSNLTALPDSAANDYATYSTLSNSITTVTANVYNTWVSLDARIDAIDAGSNTSVADLITGLEGANTNINTVQNNVTASVANLFNTYTTLSGSINTVQNNVSALPDSAANDYSTYTTLSANDYNTYTTLNTRINSIQDNIGLGVSSTAIVPLNDGTGYVGNTLYTWSSGHFVDLTIDNGLTVGGSVTIEGNLTVTGNVVSINVTELAIEDNMIYLNANSTVTNPDLGFAGNYNDGVYQHAGFFRDATDGYWKVFDGYTLEPDVSPYINTSHSSFTLASIQANNFIGNLVATVATVNSVNVLANDGITLLSARANDYTTYTTLNTRINIVQDNVATGVANTYNTYTTLNGRVNTVQSNLTSAISTLAANDGATLLTARANDYNTLLSAYSNDGSTVLTARSNDYNTYVTLNGLIDTVQSNLNSFSGGVWTEDTGRAYYVGKVVVNSNVAQTEQFFVSGNAKVSSDFEVGGTLTESSSVRLKENITPLDDQLSKLMLLRPVEYDKIASKSHEYGLIAEEVANVIPEVVSEGSTSIQYTRLIPPLIKAIQELTEKVNKLESK